jgi:prepilin-type N-terminal cleavage/methylation domain-containing protein
MKNNKGFTLIELLVVIAIIGLLATIVIVNINGSRNKSYNVAIKSGLDQTRKQAELWHNGNGINGYLNLATSSQDATKGVNMLLIYNSIIANNSAANFKIYSNATSYCAVATLKGNGAGNWCVDYKGYAGASSSNCTAPGNRCY